MIREHVNAALGGMRFSVARKSKAAVERCFRVLRANDVGIL
jgi:hypothetical protein